MQQSEDQPAPLFPGAIAAGTRGAGFVVVRALAVESTTWDYLYVCVGIPLNGCGTHFGLRSAGLNLESREASSSQPRRRGKENVYEP